MRVLAVSRGAPGLGRVVPSLALTQALGDGSPAAVQFVSYEVGTQYLRALGKEVMDIGAPDGLFIDPVSPQAVRIVELAENTAWDLVLIDGEFLLPVALAHLDLPVIYLANPHDLTGQPNTFRRVNRLLLAYADAVLISSLTSTSPARRSGLVPSTPCLEVPAIIKDFPVGHQPAAGPPRVLVSTGGGSVHAHPRLRAATDAALACMLDALAEAAVSGLIAHATVVLGADANVPGRYGHRPTGWLDIMPGPVELTDLYPHHELMIARAGRNTAAEAAYCGIPAILIPITADPHRGGEQASNARAVAHLPNIFTLPDWRDPTALRQTLHLALTYARRKQRVKGRRGNEAGARFVRQIIAGPDRPATILTGCEVFS